MKKIAKLGYMNTQLGLLPAEWKIEPFDKVFKLLSTNSFSRDNLVSEETNKKIQNIHYGDIHAKFENEILDCGVEELPYIKDELITNQNFNFIQDGDLLIVDASEDYNGVGECIEVTNVGNKKIIGGLHTFLARDHSKKTAPGFRTYIFNNQRVHTELKKIATGTSVFSVSKANLQKLLIPLPPLAEQRKIATILGNWDKAITTTTKLLKELRLLKLGLSIELLSGKKRFKNFKVSNEFTIIKGIRIPLGWHIEPLSKLVNRIKKPLLPTPDKLYTQIGIRSHTKGIFYKDEVTGLGLGKKSVYEIEPDCFIVNIVFAWEHAIAKTTSDELGMIASHRFPMYKPIDGKLDLDYMLHFFKSKRGKELLALASPGGAGRNKTLGQDEFLKLNIPVPPLDEQKMIAKALDTADDVINLYQQKLNTLQEQKKGVMQKLLTGAVRVKI